MGFFNEIGNIWAKSQGAIIAQNYMLATNRGVIGIEAVTKRLSQNCMYKAWEKHTDMFNGKFGRPHKLITALVGMFEMLDDERRELSRIGLLNAAVHLYREIEVNGKFYPFTDIDFVLLSMVSSKLEVEMEKVNEKYGNFLNFLSESKN